MRRREFIRGAGALAGAAVVGGAVSTEAFARPGATVQQVVEGGRPQPRSLLTVRTVDTIDHVDPERIHVSVPVVDPTVGETTMRGVDVIDASAVGKTLQLVVDGPVSRGAVLSFDERGISVDGRGTESFTHALDGPLERPERATQWFKAYEPTDVDLFDPRVYRGGTLPRQYPAADTATARTRLAAHLDHFVDQGRLAVEDRDASLARFDDPDVRRLFVDADGGFDPEALAGVLANAGTIARGIDTVLIDGENRFGRPYTVRRQPPPSGGLMEVRIDDGDPMILVSPRLDGEPIAALAPLFAHEGFHQDLTVGLHEEIIATYLETLVWAEHLLADPSKARLGTRAIRRANTLLLLALNSGSRAFPEMGLRAAPHRQGVANAAPNAVEPVADFVAVVESRYLRTLPGSSPGVPFAQQVIAQVTETPATALDFDVDTLGLLDERTRLFSTEELLALLATLELRPATRTAETPTSTDPVAVSDATGGDEEAGIHADVGTGHLGDCGTCQRTAGGVG
jgi:hypothetical protein